MTEAMRYKLAFERVKKLVMPVVLAKAETEKKARPARTARAGPGWQIAGGSSATTSPARWPRSAKLPRYIACSACHQAAHLRVYFSRTFIRTTQLVVFPFADDYSFGILQSGIHWAWFTATCSTLKGDFRYTSDTVFDTFPWPQSPTLAQVKAVAEAAVSLRALRREIMAANGWSLRDLYRTLETPGANRLRDAHAALDSAVRAAYGMKATEDPLAFLLA